MKEQSTCYIHQRQTNKNNNHNKNRRHHCNCHFHLYVTYDHSLYLCQTTVWHNTECTVWLTITLEKEVLWHMFITSSAVLDSLVYSTPCLGVVQKVTWNWIHCCQEETRKSMCWHHTLSKTSKQVSNWVQKGHFCCVSQDTGVCKAFILTVVKILYNVDMLGKWKQKSTEIIHNLEAHRLKSNFFF